MKATSRSLLNEAQFLVILVSGIFILVVLGISLYIVSHVMLADLQDRSIATANEMEAFLEYPLYAVDDEQAVRIAKTFLSSGKISGMISPRGNLPCPSCMRCGTGMKTSHG